jgi:hypothetical protein
MDGFYFCFIFGISPVQFWPTVHTSQKFCLFNNEVDPISVAEEIHVRWWCIIHLAVNMCTCMQMISKLCSDRALVHYWTKVFRHQDPVLAVFPQFAENVNRYGFLNLTLYDDLLYKSYLSDQVSGNSIVAMVSLLATDKHFCKHLFTIRHCSWMIIHKLKVSVYNEVFLDY